MLVRYILPLFLVVNSSLYALDHRLQKRVEVKNLAEAIAFTKENNDGIKITRSNLETSKIEKRAAVLSLVIPELTVSYATQSNSSGIIPDGYKNWSDIRTSVSAGIELYSGFHDVLNIVAHKKDCYAKANDLIDKQNEYIFGAIRSYYSLVHAREAYDIHVKSLEIAGKILEQTQLKFEVGEVKKTDVSSAKYTFARQEAECKQAESSLAIAEESFIYATGGAVAAAKLEKSQAFNVEIPATRESFIDLVLSANPTIRSSLNTLSGAKYSKGVVLSEFSPKLKASFSAGYQFNGIDYVPLNSLALSLEIPILSKGASITRAQVAIAKEDRARIAVVATKREVKKNAITVWNNYNSIIFQTKLYAQALVSARDAFDGNNIGYQAGTVTTAQLLESEKELFTFKIKYSEAYASMMVLAYEFRKLIGDLYKIDFSEAHDAVGGAMGKAINDVNLALNSGNVAKKS